MIWIVALAGAGAVAGALGMVLTRQAVRGVVSMVASFFALAVLYLTLSAEFLAVIQLIIYAGAIMVLFLFVMALMGAKAGAMRLPAGALSGQVPAALAIGLPLFGLIGWAAGSLGSSPAPIPANFGSVRFFGLELLTNQVLAFELTAVVLLVAVVGVIDLVGRTERRAERPAAEARPGARQIAGGGGN